MKLGWLYKMRYLFVILSALLGFLGFSHGEYINNVGFNYNSPRTITNQQTNNGGEYTYTTDNIGNFKTTKDNIEHNFRYFTRYGNPNSFMVMGWKNGQIYVFLTQTNSSNTATIQNQGYVSGFAILPSDYEFNTGGNIKNNIPLTTDRNTIKIILGKHNIIGFHANNKNDTANGGNTASQYYGNFMFFANNYVSNYCLITDDEIEHYICFRNSTRATNTSFYENNLTGSENKTTTSRKDITQFDTFYDEQSPIIKGGSGPTLTPINDYTNGDIWDSYANLGYVKSLCYSDFSLDDLAVSGDIEQFYPDYDDGVYYTGATVFDLYNIYSGGYGFDQFMNTYLSLWYQSYNNNTARYFVGRSKGLWYFQYKINIHRSTISQFSYQNLYNYCSFALGYNNSDSDQRDSNFTGGFIPPSTVIDGVNDKNNIPIFPSSGSVFYNTGAFIPGGGGGGGGAGGGIGSGGAGGGGSTWGDDLDCSDLENPISQFKCFYKSVDGISWDLGNYTGILPSFIGLFFLLALLFYGLKR